jgi:hypothetical protein
MRCSLRADFGACRRPTTGRSGGGLIGGPPRHILSDDRVPFYTRPFIVLMLTQFLGSTAIETVLSGLK